jgi:hypothetical protein
MRGRSWPVSRGRRAARSVLFAASLGAFAACAPSSGSALVAESATVQSSPKDAATERRAAPAALTSSSPAQTESTDPTKLPLLQLSSLTYVGAFRVPQGAVGSAAGQNFADPSGGGIAFNPAHTSLFLVGNSDHNFVGEIAIPGLGNQTAATPVASLPVARTLVAPVDLTEGTVSVVGGPYPFAGAIAGGGLAVFGNYLYWTEYIVYDGSGSQQVETWRHPIDLTVTGQAQGPYHVRVPGLDYAGAGAVSGALTAVPAAWRDRLDADVLSSQTGISIISRTSFGPDAVGWRVANWGAGTWVDGHGKAQKTTPATNLLFYSQEHPLAGIEAQPPGPHPWSMGQGIYWNLSHLTRGGGVVFPKGYRSLLEIGAIGRGYYNYGISVPTNPPNPAVTVQYAIAGSNASTDTTGRRVTVPNMDLTNLSTGGDKMLWLSKQSTPLQNPTSNNSVRPGCARIIGKGNSGTASAYIEVDQPYPPNLTNQPFMAGEPNVYDPVRIDGQGNHAYPYMPMVYHYDANDLLAVKQGRKQPSDVRPLDMWDLTSLLPAWQNHGGQIGGAAYDESTQRIFVMQPGVDGSGYDYPVIYVLQIR